MQKPQVVTYFFVPAEQHAPEAIHPAMRALHDPPPGFETGLVLQGLSFLAPRSDMGCEPELVQQVSHLVVVIAFVQTHPLGSLCWGLRSFHGSTLDRLACQFDLITVRTVHGQTDRHATAVGEDAALGADRAAVRGVLAHLFPPQGGLGSLPRPSPARPSQSPARHHMPPSPVPLRPQKRLPPPTLGNGDGRHYWNTSSSCSAHSTGTRYAAQKRWHPSLCDHRRGADGTLKGAVSVGGATAQGAPIIRQVYASPGGFSRGHSASVRLLMRKIFPQRIPDNNLM